MTDFSKIRKMAEELQAAQRDVDVAENGMVLTKRLHLANVAEESELPAICLALVEFVEKLDVADKLPTSVAFDIEHGTLRDELWTRLAALVGQEEGDEVCETGGKA